LDFGDVDCKDAVIGSSNVCQWRLRELGKLKLKANL